MPDMKDNAQEVLKTLSVKNGQRYRHFKGGEYKIIAIAIKEDSLEPLVIYRSILKKLYVG